jgi:sulfide:quinone oxidoreductase
MKEPNQTRFSVLVVGGGAGGISVAARLRRAHPALDIAIIEPAAYHYYQPAWTLVGGGKYAADATRRSMRECIPKGVTLITASVERFEPSSNAVVLNDGVRLDYECLLVAAGIELHWDGIKGLRETLGQNGVTSNYRYDLAPYTWQCLQALNGGVALFTQPVMPIKCAGAPQKILYLAADFFRSKGRKVAVSFLTPGASMFGVPFYAKALGEVMKAYGATPHFGHELVEVDGPARTATFQTTVDNVKTLKTMTFDMIHVVPPQRAPQCVRESELADAAGWLEVDAKTLQHVRYPNVFGIGDCTSTPNSKTAAAVKNQGPVVTANIAGYLAGQQPSRQYDGYASCPLTTSRSKVMLAEFCYDGAITPSFPMDPRVPRKVYWWLKAKFLPFLYWRIVLTGLPWPETHRKRAFPEKVPPITP